MMREIGDDMFKFFQRKSKVQHKCLELVYELPNEILLLIMTYLTVHELFKLRNISKKLYELTSNKFIWSKPWQSFICGLFSNYELTKDDSNNALRQYINFRSLPKYAKNPHNYNALINAVRKNCYSATKFLLKSGANVDRRDTNAIDIDWYTSCFPTPLLASLCSINENSKSIKILKLLFKYHAQYSLLIKVTKVIPPSVTYGGGTRCAYVFNMVTIDSIALAKSPGKKKAILHLAKAEDALIKSMRNFVIKKQIWYACWAKKEMVINYIQDLQIGNSLRSLQSAQLNNMLKHAKLVIKQYDDFMKNKKKSKCKIL
jgi:hypothetical protein